MTNGKSVAQRLRGSPGGGIPWMAILDADGQTLVTSDGPQGNIGFPAMPQGIDHFMAMLESTATGMTAEHTAEVRKRLDDNARKLNSR